MTANIIQKIWETADIPHKLNKAYIWLIPKGKEGLDKPQNHRPISLMNFWAKILDKILNRQITQHLEKHQTLSDEQAGFRKGRNCTEQILTLELIT